MKLVDIICKTCQYTEEFIVDSGVKLGDLVVYKCPYCGQTEFFTTILSAPKISALFSESHREKLQVAYERWKLESEARKKEFREGKPDEAKKLKEEAAKIKIKPTN